MEHIQIALSREALSPSDQRSQNRLYREEQMRELWAWLRTRKVAFSTREAAASQKYRISENTMCARLREFAVAGYIRVIKRGTWKVNRGATEFDLRLDSRKHIAKLSSISDHKEFLPRNGATSSAATLLDRPKNGKVELDRGSKRHLYALVARLLHEERLSRGDKSLFLEILGLDDDPEALLIHLPPLPQ